MSYGPKNDARRTSRLCDFHIRMKPSYACGPRAGRPMGHRRAHGHSNKLAIYGRLRMARFSVNGQSHNIDVDPSTPLLWVLREQVGLTGTKYGCGIAQCGACTVHVDGAATRSCSVPVSTVEGKQITTIKGLRRTARCTRCKRPGLSTTCRNAVIASPA